MLQWLDEGALRLVADLRWGPLTALMTLLSAWWVKGVVIAAVGGIADLRRRPRAVPGSAVLATLALLLASLSADLLKEVVGRARPPLADPGLTALVGLPGDGSMPSGHAATAAAAAASSPCCTRACACRWPRWSRRSASRGSTWGSTTHPTCSRAWRWGSALGWAVVALARRAVRARREDGARMEGRPEIRRPRAAEE